MSHRTLAGLSRNARDTGQTQQIDRNFHHFGGVNPNPSDLSEAQLISLAKMINATGATAHPRRDQQNNYNPAAGRIGVPAGYTYLFQLAGHDLTHTSLEPRGLGDNDVRPENLRRQGLRLETVFGGGAMGCPFAYDRSEDGKDRLRIGQVEDTTLPAYKDARIAWSEPTRDLPRMFFRADGGQDKQQLVTDVLIPDARNDDNNILAQLTALFHGLYNLMVDHSDVVPQTHERARIARLATARIYRRVLRHDLMRRILHPDVFTYYQNGGDRVDRPDDSNSVSWEFAFAAARVAHGMVRDSYNLNAELGSVELLQLILTSSSHFSDMTPTRRNWLLDWDLFFTETDADQQGDSFNWALRFGPHVAAHMTARDAAPAQSDDHPTGTPFRDMMREQLLDLPRVEDLCAAMSGGLADMPALNLAQGASLRRGMMAEQLEMLKIRLRGKTFGLSDADLDQIAAAPPLNLYLMCEAKAWGQDGATLGPLGSVLVAEAMWAAFATEPQNEDIEDARRIEAAALGGETPKTMPALLRLMRAKTPKLFET